MPTIESYALDPLLRVPPDLDELYQLGGIAVAARPDLLACRRPTSADPRRWAAWTAYLPDEHKQAMPPALCRDVIDAAEADPGGWEPGRSPHPYALKLLPNALRAQVLAVLEAAARDAVKAWSPSTRLTAVQNAQLLRYEKCASFGAHHDVIPTHPDRVLGVVVQLSEPDAYDDGALLVGPLRVGMPDQQGSVIVVPALQVHEVTPVTRGTRYALTAFVTGYGGWGCALGDEP